MHLHLSIGTRVVLDTNTSLHSPFLPTIVPKLSAFPPKPLDEDIMGPKPGGHNMMITA